MTGVGPELARALGGTWDANWQEVLLSDAALRMDATGQCWLFRLHQRPTRLGSMSDGVDALAAAARNHGVGT